MKKWQTLSSKIVFDTRWVKVYKDKVELPNGKIIDDFYTWSEQNVSQVVAITEAKKIVFVKQYKHAANEICIELPAGYVDEGESFAAAAKRELLEETGYKTDKLTRIGKLIHSPTKSPGIVQVFLAKDVKKTSLQKLDKNEDIEVLEFGFAEVVEMINDGKIWASGTIASIFLALNRLKYKL